MDKQKLEEARRLAMSMTSHPVAFGTTEQTERAGELLGELVKANEALAREAHTWSKAAETYAADAERFHWLAEHTVATGLARWVHPFQFLAEAVDARRKLNRPPTPVGWSDTDWIAHLEQVQQNEAAYARGPLPERGWD